MKRIVLAMSVIFIAGLFCVATQEYVHAKELRIGYVDMEKVSREYTKIIETRKDFDEKVNAKEEERKKLVGEITKLKEEQELLSDKAKSEKQKVITEKTRSLQDFIRKAQAELMDLRDKTMGEVQGDVDKVIAGYSKEAAYDIILIKQTVLYASDQLDVTGEVVKRLNKK